MKVLLSVHLLDMIFSVYTDVICSSIPRDGVANKIVSGTEIISSSIYLLNYGRPLWPLETKDIVSRPP